MTVSAVACRSTHIRGDGARIAGVATDNDILERARLANEDVYSSLQSFVCNEEINRFRGNLSSQSAKSLDKVTAKLSFERGVEQYSEVYQNSHQRSGPKANMARC